MSLRQVLTIFNTERLLNSDETALLNALRSWTDAERQLFIDSLSDKPQKKSSKKSAGKGAGKSQRASGMAARLNKSLQQQRKTTADESDDDNRFDGVLVQSARVELLGEDDARCQFIRADDKPCHLLPDHNIHHMTTANEFHPFVPLAQSAEPQSTTGSSGTGKAAAGSVHHVVSGGG